MTFVVSVKSLYDHSAFLSHLIWPFDTVVPAQHIRKLFYFLVGCLLLVREFASRAKIIYNKNYERKSFKKERK